MSVDSSKEGQEWPEDTEWEPWDYYHGRERFRRYRVHSKDGIDGKYKGWIGSELLSLDHLNALESAARNAEARIRELADGLDSALDQHFDLPRWRAAQLSRELHALISPSTGEKAAGEVGE